MLVVILYIYFNVEINHCMPSDAFFEQGGGLADYPVKDIPDKHLKAYIEDTSQMSKANSNIHTTQDAAFDRVKSQCG